MTSTLVKNKFLPFIFIDNINLKSFFISLSNEFITFNGLPFIMCAWLIKTSKVGNAFCNKITHFLFFIFLINIVLHEPNFFYFIINYSLIFIYFTTKWNKP